MQKVEKSKKENRMLQMKYPAPYSQSWAGMGHPRRSFLADKSSIKTISGGQSRILTVKPSVRTTVQADDTRRERDNSFKMPRCIVEPKRLKIERPAIAKASTVQRFLKNPSRAQGESSDGPVFVFRPLEHRNLRSLTVSASTHLDIKPRPLRGPILSPQLYKRYI